MDASLTNRYSKLFPPDCLINIGTEGTLGKDNTHILFGLNKPWHMDINVKTECFSSLLLF